MSYKRQGNGEGVDGEMDLILVQMTYEHHLDQGIGNGWREMGEQCSINIM
jgi:hypothetical protein